MSNSAFPIPYQFVSRSPRRVCVSEQGRDEGAGVVAPGGLVRRMAGARRPRLSVKLFVRMRSQGRLLRRSLFFLFMVSKSAEAMMVATRGGGGSGGAGDPPDGPGGGRGPGGSPPRDPINGTDDFRADDDGDDYDPAMPLRFFINTRTHTTEGALHGKSPAEEIPW